MSENTNLREISADILEGEMSFPVRSSKARPSPFLLLKWTQSRCFARLEQKHTGDAVSSIPCPDCQTPHRPLDGFCSPAAFARRAGAVRSAGSAVSQPQRSRLPPCLRIHPSFQRESRHTARRSSTHPYSRDTAVVVGRFILRILPTLDFVLQCLFSEVLKLWWQHCTDLLNYCLIMTTLRCLSVIPCGVM